MFTRALRSVVLCYEKKELNISKITIYEFFFTTVKKVVELDIGF